MENTWKQNLRALSQFTADFFKSKTGKGPKNIKTHLIENKILIEMSNLLTPMEREVASTLDGIINVKLARERFYEKNAENYQISAGQIMNCHILYSCATCDVINDEAFIFLTLDKHFE